MALALRGAAESLHQAFPSPEQTKPTTPQGGRGEVQAINTCPDNFLWEKNKCSIICVAPGLYQMVFGFYSKKDPLIQIFLNGEPLQTASKV